MSLSRSVKSNQVNLSEHGSMGGTVGWHERGRLTVSPVPLWSYGVALLTLGDPALGEHFAEVPQGEAKAQPPQHSERDDVGRVLRPVQ